MKQLAIRREGDRVIVELEGDIVASSVPALRTALLELVRSGVKTMAVDLGRATMIDSTGLGLLLSAYNSLKALHGAFSVVEVPAEILDLFRTMRLHQHFPVSGRQTNS